MGPKFEVFGDRVLVKPDSPEQITKGGIIIPSNAQAKTYWGTIMGKGAEVDIKGLEVGRHVYYDKYAGTPVSSGGSDYVIVKQTDVLGGE